MCRTLSEGPLARAKDPQVPLTKFLRGSVSRNLLVYASKDADDIIVRSARL